uniref:BAR domain-containing protein n=1 Tax=Noccaea caerulescens TaxID=107243 RepID=A0A1J3GG92_NOCCA
MKASIGRLKRFTSHKVDAKEKGELVATAEIDELARAGKDMQDMRDCYDRLLSAAAATANSAYEFSVSLGEMGSCLEQIAPHNDEESGRILLMLGQVQFELQKLLDKYRSHIFKTITAPSESLLQDLRNVEDMKQQCDEKRNVFEMALVKEKGRPKSSKGERHIPPESRPAYNEFHDEATMCIFRLKSLKEGQARSLLTQAVRHHTAQMRLFHTGMKSLEAVERHVRVSAEKQHIDCDLSVHENEVEASEDDNGHYMNRDGEVSLAYRANEQMVEAASLSTPRGSMKMDDSDLSFPRPSTTRAAAVNADHREEHPISTRDHRMTSHSAPLFPEKKPDLSERLRQTNPSSNAYVLPTPIDSKYSKPASQALNPRPANIWHSSPLEPIKSGKDAENNSLYVRLPRPSTTDAHNHHQQQQTAARHAFSGPLKPSSAKPLTTTDLSSGAFRPLPIPPAPQPHPHPSSSPKVSPTASPPPGLSSSPRLNELHELPRPPGHFAPPPRRAKSPGLLGHSAPLTGWNQERNSATVAPPSSSNIVASPLPVPPLVVPRSFSIPSSHQRAFAQRSVERTDDSVAASPPLTPMSLSRPIPQATGVAQTSQIRGY